MPDAQADGRTRPFVSIIMPALDEEAYIGRAISSILPDERELDYEILVLDGGSTDGTHEAVAVMSAANPRIRLVANEQKIQAAAMNLGARIADPRATILLRADCHAEYPERFVESCVRDFMARQAAAVVVPMTTVGKTCIQRGVAAAQTSRFGNGGSAHRRSDVSSRYVDHGHHALFDRSVFLELGGYDERMPCNEDAELDQRINDSGQRIWLNADAAITYFPRASFVSLARQYYRYGSGRAFNWFMHGKLKLRQSLPLAALAAVSGSLLLSFVDIAFLIVALSYLFVCLACGAALALRSRSACDLFAGPALPVMHMSWAVGFVVFVASTFLPGRAREIRNPLASPAARPFRQSTGL